uniref:Uncharacterized protein n=1 Tax=Glossina pallidipes TaxID=7398 RepID=A0A1B0AHL9_GLOPL
MSCLIGDNDNKLEYCVHDNDGGGAGRGSGDRNCRNASFVGKRPKIKFKTKIWIITYERDMSSYALEGNLERDRVI